MQLYNQDVFWSTAEAFEKGAYIAIKAWDMTDNRNPGVHDKSIEDNGTSISKKFVNFLLLRRGCDNRTDFPARNDRCGVCRGKDECVACDSVPYSNATISKLFLPIHILIGLLCLLVLTENVYSLQDIVNQTVCCATIVNKMVPAYYHKVKLRLKKIRLVTKSAM